MATYLNDSPIFGPVRSRRLGISLGVNLMPSTGKICSFDCIYCENGFNDERRTSDTYASREEVAEALEAMLQEMAARDERPDVITFAGNGEPTASPVFPGAIDDAVQLRNALAPKAKIAVLSNGTLAHKPKVHAALMKVDDNILKLDTVSQEYISLLDRPVSASYDVEQQIKTFASFEGHAIIQTIFVRGTWQGQSVDNTGEKYVAPWLDALARIKPEAATIYTIARDTPAEDLLKAEPAQLDAIAERVRALGIECTVAY